MGNPVLVEITRGGLVESRHTGSIAVADPGGRVVFALGDLAIPVFPRSAIKAIQALLLVESGAADRHQFGDAELALACASHGGEVRHAEVAAGMLAKAGFDHTILECGAHWPMNEEAKLALAASGGRPSALHNNCSGKHAGFVCAACAIEADPRGYVGAEHPVQRAVKAALEDVSGAAIPDARRGVDGCSVPTWALPLADLARAFARIGTGLGLGPARADALGRLRAACAAQPYFVAGAGRFCTGIMTHFRERVFVKTGAEGVFCGALPEHGLGIAIKCDDGGKRAAEVAMAAMIARFLPLDSRDEVALAPFLRPKLRNWNGIDVGEVRPAAAIGAGRR